METLTPRQIEILKNIIVEYTQTGEPVGSEILDKKYNLGVSPATVRNETVELAKRGYLKKVHFSSGRVPTAEAFRFYIKNLMKEKELSTAEEISYKSDVWDFRKQFHHFLQNLTRVLARNTSLLALSTTNLGDLYFSGLPNILSLREFWDIELSRAFFERLDQLSFWQDILGRFEGIEDELLFLMGAEDLQEQKLESCGLIFGEFEGKKVKGTIGVVGPKRMYYETVIPHIRYSINFAEQVIKKQGF